ncbi:MAG: hypothetical protein ACP5JS_08765 [Fervidobacterium sp.]
MNKLKEELKKFTGLSKILSILAEKLNFILNLIVRKREIKNTITLAFIHFDGNNLEQVLNEFNVELRSADVIVGKNVTAHELKKHGVKLSKKCFVLINKGIESSGILAEFIGRFDVKRLRTYEKQGTQLIVTTDKQIAWMISQMFPFYCVVPSEPFQECLITAPIPLTRNSDGYYFSKTTFRNQVTLIDLNIGILSDFRSAYRNTNESTKIREL